MSEPFKWGGAKLSSKMASNGKICVIKESKEVSLDEVARLIKKASRNKRKRQQQN